MAHPIWKGAISFGLVNIPVSLFSGLKRDEDIHFHLLRKSDQSRVRNKRVAEADDEEVPWDDIVKGYEYQKGKYVIMTEEEMDSVELKSTRVMDIASFVDLEEIDPVYFSTPYLVQAEKGGEKAYHLLADVLADTKTCAIAKVVLRSGREHLVAVMARDKRLVADMLYFHQELKPVTEITAPEGGKIQERERDMARKLIDSMKAKWDPDAFKDEYEKALKALIARKLSGKKIKAPKIVASRPSNVIDLVDILRQSLDQKGGSAKKSTPKSKSKKVIRMTAKHRKAA